MFHVKQSNPANKYWSDTLIKKYLPDNKVERYIDEALQANRKFNLFSRNLSENDLRRLIAESLVIIDLGYLDKYPGRILDIGSGWGIPAIPLLIARPALDVTMVERSKKKADFLTLQLNRLQIKGTVFGDDIKGISDTQKYSLFTARQVTIDNCLWINVRRLASNHSYLIYFGPSSESNAEKSIQSIEFSMDDTPAKKITLMPII